MEQDNTLAMAPMGMSREAYMIHWRDRVIEKKDELIKALTQECRLMGAFLAWNMLQEVSQTREEIAIEIPKEIVPEMMGRWSCFTGMREDTYVLHFQCENGGADAACKA